MRALSAVCLGNEQRLKRLQAGPDGGAFLLKLRKVKLIIIASFEGGWDHVSVSCAKRSPTWVEMCEVKDIFFDDDDTVIQYHPAKRNYVNNHPHCLHLWRPQYQNVERSGKAAAAGRRFHLLLRLSRATLGAN